MSEYAGASLDLQVVNAGKSFGLSGPMGDDNTISELRAVVAILTGVPVGRQKFIYKGTVLKNDTQK
jgi:Ubiquitin family